MDDSNDTIFFYLETPWRGISAGDPVRISGWCFDPKERIEKLQILLGDKKFDVDYGHERQDVAQIFCDNPHALNCGFLVVLPSLDAGKYQVNIRVQRAGHDWKPSKTNQVVIKFKYPRFFDNFAKFLNLQLSFFLFATQSGLSWVSTHRRVPRPSEFLHLIRLTRHLHGNIESDNASLTPPEGFSTPPVTDPYQCWIKVNKIDSNQAVRMHRFFQEKNLDWPVLSVVMPVYNPSRKWLSLAIESVIDQTYPYWELCIADDCSEFDWLEDYLNDLARQDQRIRWVRREINGNISQCTNSAAAMADGDYLCLMDQDDLLSPDALGEVALAINNHPEADILYSDDDKINEAGHRYDPQFKPDWSPELLLSYMYLSHLFVIRKTLFQAVGGLRSEYDGSQDYDLALRLSEKTDNVVHIPRILYHWRSIPGSTASSGDAKPTSLNAGERALKDAFSRRRVAASVYRPEWAVKGGLGLFSHRFPDDGPSVAILIPSRNNWQQLRRCLQSLKKTRYQNQTTIVIDNGSDETETLAYLEHISEEILTIPNGSEGFSYAAVNNEAVRSVNADYVLFLNDDTEVLEPGWLSTMMGYAQIPGVGAVGARLLFPNRTVQHAGIVNGYYDGMAGPAFKGLPDWHGGYLSYAKVTRNYSAVTAACLLTSRSLFLQQGGFDESAFPVAYNDVDYCYRLLAAGYRSVYAAGAELIHYEGYSRGSGGDDPAEVLCFRQRYRDFIDPYYNPNLSLKNEAFCVEPRRFLSRTDFVRGKKRPLRALMCAFTLNHEGAPYSQYELTLSLVSRGTLEPVVYSPTDGPLRNLYEQAGIKVVVSPHPLLGVFDIDAYDAAIDTFSDWMKSLDLDLVYCNTLQTFFGIEAANRLGLPSLWNIRESEPWQTYFDFHVPPVASRALACFAYPYRIIFVAHATRRGFEELNSKNHFSVIHNGLDVRRFGRVSTVHHRLAARQSLGVEDQDFMVLLLGTVTERKGQLDLIEACAHIKPALHDRLKVFIVGDRKSEYSDRLHEAHRNLPEPLRSQVKILPETADAKPFYTAADCFVCASRVESYPRVVLEAMLFSLPIITTQAFGIIEQVREGFNADFYSAGNALELSERLSSLMTDPQRLQRYRHNAPLVLQSLTQFDEMSTAYAQLFLEAADLPRPPSSSINTSNN